jgi:uncharacterized BrkB/YihY/UPF0761 family membrane protein
VVEDSQESDPGDRRRVTGAVDWARAQNERALDAAERARAWAERERQRSPRVALAFDLAERDRARLGGLLAGALAYRLFLWLLPFTLFLVGALGAVTSIDDGAANDVSDRVGLQGFLGDLLSDGARQRGWWIAMLIGLFGCVYAGLGVVRALRISHAAAWGIAPSRGRKTLRGSLCLLAIALALTAISGLIGWLSTVSSVGGLIALLATMSIYFVGWVAISWRLPHRGVSARALMPGALLLAVGVEGLGLFTAYYLAGQAERAASLYGTIGAALALLFWLFIIARLMVGAAILNAELCSRNDQAEEAA